ncbi:MAG: hypothetical protein JWL64_2748, partial [Frankiales bacterium]|nr:hypothetical protein [Frankiales bacterium]
SAPPPSLPPGGQLPPGTAESPRPLPPGVTPVPVPEQVPARLVTVPALPGSPGAPGPRRPPSPVVSGPTTPTGPATAERPSPSVPLLPGQIADTLVPAIVDVVGKPALPLALLFVVVVFLLVQNRLDRRDPKLAAAPVQSEPELTFEPAYRPEARP